MGRFLIACSVGLAVSSIQARAQIVTVGGPMASRTLHIVVQRTGAQNGLLTGTISVNGEEIGETFENDEFRIQSGAYTGVLRYVDQSGFVQGPFGSLARSGDFLVEIQDAKHLDSSLASSILFHSGNLPAHSKGCILLGPVHRDSATHVGTIPDSSPLRRLRLLFYGSETPNATPNLNIAIDILDPVGGALPDSAP